MNSETRLAEIVTALEGIDTICLVMEGYAVRYYELFRNTIDFNLHLEPECWDDLPARRVLIPLFTGHPIF